MQSPPGTTFSQPGSPPSPLDSPTVVDPVDPDDAPVDVGSDAADAPVDVGIAQTATNAAVAAASLAPTRELIIGIPFLMRRTMTPDR
jgi:hypothetical protein